MKTLFLAVALASLSEAQTGGRPVAGVWTAEFDGRTFIRLELHTANGTIAGGISLGDLQVNQQGGVQHVGELPKRLVPIVDVAQRGSVLTFSRKDGHDTDRFELRVLDAGAAELLFIPSEEDLKELAAAGIPAPKPIRLTKR